MTNLISENEIKMNLYNKKNTIASDCANLKENQVKINQSNLNGNEKDCKAGQCSTTELRTRPRRKTRNEQCIKSNGEVDEKNQMKKNNCTAIIVKNKILSPNHKLTEYFSDLNVNDCPINPDKIAKANFKDEQASKTKECQNNKDLLPAKKKLSKNKINFNTESTNRKVTDYFTVRRSERKYKKSIIEEEQKDLENKIISEIDNGLKIVNFEDKGRGIATTKPFLKGEFVIEYIGDLIDAATAKQRELKYSKNKKIGCYMYYFKHKNVQYCIDATEESGKLGRLINHSRKGNLVSRIVEINEVPRLVLFAKKDIPVGTEVLYDYGDRSRESVKNHPWLNF